MTFTSLSVLVPTRKRVPQLTAMLESFYRTSHADNCELVFRVDDDDAATQALLKSTPWTVVVGPRGLGYRAFPQFTQELRGVATGDVFMIGNDDMVFQTPDWPARLLAVANRYPDGLFDLSVSTFNETHVPWSTISRAAVDVLGHIHDPRLFWGDVYLRDVFAAFDRVIKVPDVQIDHVWMGQTPDATFLEAKQGEHRNWDAAYWSLHRRCVADAIAKLRTVEVPA